MTDTGSGLPRLGTTLFSLTLEQRDTGVADLIELVYAVDGILQVQAAADAEYFLAACGRGLPRGEADAVREAFLRAYRWQYIGSGVTGERFLAILMDMVDAQQAARIQAALRPVLQ